MTMQTGLEELTEKAQRQSTEAAAQLKEATGPRIKNVARNAARELPLRLLPASQQ
jgi:hypothetical protein